MGPTWPNRFYLHAGTSDGIKANSPIYGLKASARNSIFGQVEAKKRDFATKFPGVDPNRLCVNFFADVPLLPIMFPSALSTTGGVDFINLLPNFNYARIFDQARDSGASSLERFATSVFGSATPNGLLKMLENARAFPTFETLAREGKLPPISYIEPPFQLAPCDDHPPHDILAGQAFVSSIYKILKESKDWANTLFIITYDEHGSFYDHVAPGKNTADTNAEFRQLGFRVPALVIGPGVKKGYVSKVQYEHCSVLSTMTNRFGLAPSNDRVRVSRDISDCIDGSTRGGASGGLQLNRVDLSEAHVLETARVAGGQKEIVEKVFGGNVPFEAKRVYTNEIFETFDRLGVASIRR